MSVINTNIKALAAQDSSRIAENKLSTAMQRLSTGLRINSAKDDAAGLAISTRMTAQVRGFGMAIRNANDGISLTQTAEGAMGQVQDMLQRMRELAVQASSGTLNQTDREALQMEVGQLRTEIDSIASKTSFNNIKLLDGSAKNVTLQTGVNAGEQMSVGFDSVKSKDIGMGAQAALSSVGGRYNASATNAEFTAFTSGSLLLNGVAVGASLATDDSASFANAAASAIAKVAAINRVADQSGVSAKVGATVVGGARMTNAQTASFHFTINGVNTAEITTTGDTSVSRSRVVSAINAISNQTGVTAIDTQDDNQGVVLKAADGRNITVADSLGTSAADSAAVTGVSVAKVNAADSSEATTYVGSYDLFTKDGSSFTVDQAFNSNINTTGLRMGKFQSGVAETVTFNRGSTVGAAPANTSGVLNGNTLIINDVQISAAIAGDDTSSFASTASTKAASAIAIAAAINKKSDTTGVKAVANANIIGGNDFAAGTVGQIFLNGETISVSTHTRSNVMDAINAKSAVTGVTAKEYGNGMQLVAEDGRNIVIATGSDLTAANLGLGGISIGQGATAAPTVSESTAFYSTVSLTSDKSFRVQSGSEGVSNFELLGFRTGTFGGETNGPKVSEIDISTTGGASQALQVIDAALEKVTQNRSMAGAFNNRLDEVVNNLSTMNQNITASRSRIQDTDYATETTTLAKNQIVQQAATAMLAQANQSAQTVLALLK
jgi:flagellin